MSAFEGKGACGLMGFPVMPYGWMLDDGGRMKAPHPALASHRPLNIPWRAPPSRQGLRKPPKRQPEPLGEGALLTR